MAQERSTARDEAIALGRKRYFTGEPCINGHIVERHVSDWKCIQCKKDGRKDWALLHPDEVQKHRARWEAKNPNSARQRVAKSKAKHLEKVRAADRIRARKKRRAHPRWTTQ